MADPNDRLPDSSSHASEVSVPNPTQMQLVERERTQISHELHDGLVQWIVGAKLQTEAMRAKALRQQDVSAADLEYVLVLLGNAMREARQLMARLHSPDWEHGDWLAMLQQWLAIVTNDQSPAIELNRVATLDQTSDLAQQCIYRIAQEAIGNALRHAHASRIKVLASPENGRWHLCIEDDGKGFSMDQVKHDRFGLKGMRQRAAMLGGTVEIESIPDQGTTVRAVIPAVPSDPLAAKQDLS